MDLYPTSGIAAITALCWLLGEGVKASPLDERFIPLLCGLCGALLGLAGRLCLPDFPARDPITAAALGAAAGLAATGAHEAFAQLR